MLSTAEINVPKVAQFIDARARACLRHTVQIDL